MNLVHAKNICYINKKKRIDLDLKVRFQAVETFKSHN